MNNQIFPHVVEIMKTLDETDFFKTNPFIDKDILCKKLIMTLHTKASEEGEFVMLTESEFVEVVNETIKESVNETILSLSEKGAIDIGVNADGEFVISKNPDFNVDEL